MPGWDNGSGSGVTVSNRQLVSLEVFGPDEELRAKSTTGVAGRQADADAEGRDATRAVTVRLDPRGRVSDVLISNWWRDELTPSDLQEAVLSAYRAALGRAAANIHPEAVGGRPFTSVPPPPDMPDELDDLTWFHDVQRRLDRTEEALEQSSRQLRDDDTNERVVSGPDGLVRLVTTGGTVSQVQIDTHAALRESSNRLAADALAAFQAVR